MSGGRSALDDNLTVLEASHPGLAALLRGTSFESYELVETRSGFPTARVGGKAGGKEGGRLLHSGYDPPAEARRLVEASLPPGADTVLILGPGLGYAIEAALEPLPTTAGLEHVLVCEADPARLAALFEARDLRRSLADPRLSWLVGGEPGAVLLALEEFRTRIVGIVGSVGTSVTQGDRGQSVNGLSDQPGLAWYQALRGAVDRFSAKEAINENTLRRFGRLWVRNLARNAVALAGLPGIRDLAGLFAGLPAVVVAAGPSLDELLPRLAEIRERCLVVAVDTALRSLLAHGLEPDFLVVVDPQYWNWRHVADLAAPTSLLVSEAAVWPPVLRSPRRAAFLCSSLFPLGRALAAGGEDRGSLGAGGSVATSAWDLARHLGAASIWMAGLDLGFPAGHTHARASLFEQRTLSQASRLRPAAGFQAAALFGAPSFTLPANDGGWVQSDQRMALYAWWFESRLARRDSPRTLSLSKQGAAIPGMAFAEPGALLESPPRRAEIDALLARAAALVPPAGARDASARAKAALLEELARIESLASEGRAAASQGRQILAATGDAAPALAALDRIDAALHAIDSRDVAGFLLPPLRELLGKRPRSLAESLAASEALYDQVALAAREHLEILGRLSGD